MVISNYKEGWESSVYNGQPLAQLKKEGENRYGESTSHLCQTSDGDKACV